MGNYINSLWTGRILSVSPLSRDNIYWQNSMKEYGETIQVAEQGPYTRLLLANHESRCSRLRQEVQPLPTISLNLKGDDSRSNHHHKPLGIDIVGLLPTAPAQKKLLLVATYYFSKWIKAEDFTSIKDKDVVQFVWKNIVC